MKTPEKNKWSSPAWAVLLAAPPLFAALWGGPLFIDDAFITFRYAANLAAGHGFVYNSAPVLGTTAPFYCLLLALFNTAGLPIGWTALAIGAASAAAAPVLLWRIGIAGRRPAVGLLAGLCLAFFPHWWLNSKTGMETTLAGALALLAIYFEVKGRSLWSGLACSLLVLTRPDAAALPAIIFALEFFKERKKAWLFAAGGLPLVVGWAVFGAFYFGSPLPQSLAAKSLIHFYPWYLAAGKYLGWLFAVREPAGMFILTSLYVAGAAFIWRQWPEARAVSLWPPLFFLGLAFTQVGAFFWYKVPALPVMFLGAAFFACLVSDTISAEPENPSKMPRAVPYAIALLPLMVILVQAVLAVPWFTGPELRENYIAKETVLRSMAAKIDADAETHGLAPGSSSVLAGEVGVLGYELPKAEIIDSAGINSPELYEIRKDDWKALKASRPDYGWEEQWAGSAGWARSAVSRFKPDYIASDLRYLHLRELLADPGFMAEYELVESWEGPDKSRFVLLGRRDRGRG